MLELVSSEDGATVGDGSALGNVGLGDTVLNTNPRA